jgi:hypothetical protein
LESQVLDLIFPDSGNLKSVSVIDLREPHFIKSIALENFLGENKI